MRCKACVTYDYTCQYRWYDEEKEYYEETDDEGNVRRTYRWVDVLQSDDRMGFGCAYLTYAYVDGKWELSYFSNQV